MSQHLARGTVILWSFRIDDIDASVVAACRLTLPNGEQARADRFHFEQHRTLYTVAHAMKRAMLTHHGASCLRFRTNKWGKPEIEAPGNALRFNLTHTRGLVACAVTTIDDLGIDAEARDRAIDCLALAEHFFAPSEAAYLGTLPETDRTPAFLRIWTLKEAFIKAVGKGLAIPLADFAFNLEPFSFTCIPSLGHAAGEWRFRSFTFGTTHHLAVALHRPKGGDIVLHHRHLSAEELVALAGTGKIERK